MRHIWQELLPALNASDPLNYGIDTKHMKPSVEWDILSVTSRRNRKRQSCCDEESIDITFHMTMRRKVLFHTVNLIIPSVAISFLTVLVFYLPSESREKIALCISILLSLTVFFLLLAEIIPPTSIVVPLIGQYLLFTMCLVTLSIVVTVVVINVHFRSPATHRMSPWVRSFFLRGLPRLLRMSRPSAEESDTERVLVRTKRGMQVVNKHVRPSNPCNTSITMSHFSQFKRKYRSKLRNGLEMQNSVARHGANYEYYTFGMDSTDVIDADMASSCSYYQYNDDVRRAVDGIVYIAEKMKQEDEDRNVSDIW